METRNWKVSVYSGEKVIATWTIENRTDGEASQEAASDIERDYPDADWTLHPAY